MIERNFLNNKPLNRMRVLLPLKSYNRARYLIQRSETEKIDTT
jgi:hypothetical protein